MTKAPVIAAKPPGKAWYCLSAEEALAQLGSTATGLSVREAAQRFTANGPNELKEGKRTSPWQIFLGQFKSLIVGLLVGASVLALVMGDHLEAAARAHAIPTVRGGTYLVMEGPQFSTRAESQLYRSWGCDVIGMTNMPEAKLAREAEICYATVAICSATTASRSSSSPRPSS